MKSKKLAEKHIKWFLNIIKPLLIENFIHGYKHGFNDKMLKEEKKNEPTIYK